MTAWRENYNSNGNMFMQWGKTGTSRENVYHAMNYEAVVEDETINAMTIAN